MRARLSRDEDSLRASPSLSYSENSLSNEEISEISKSIYNMPYVSNMSSKSNSELIADSSDESSSVYDMNEESGLIKDKEQSNTLSPTQGAFLQR